MRSRAPCLRVVLEGVRPSLTFYASRRDWNGSGSVAGAAARFSGRSRSEPSTGASCRLVPPMTGCPETRSKSTNTRLIHSAPFRFLYRPLSTCWMPRGTSVVPGYRRRSPSLYRSTLSPGINSVSARTRNLTLLLSDYRAAGLRHVSYRFYPGARHELFNEINRDEVTEDVVVWLNQVVG